jgi:hypothetical protein
MSLLFENPLGLKVGMARPEIKSLETELTIIFKILQVSGATIKFLGPDTLRRNNKSAAGKISYE